MQQIKDIITKAFEKLNEIRENKFILNEDTKFIGNEGILDSLDLVNFIILIEEEIFNKTGKQITLVNENAFSRTKSPFYNMETLSKYIEEFL